MYSKEEFIQDIAYEFGIIKHLYTKIPEGQLGFRLSPYQRSTEELLRFLSNFAEAMMHALLKEDVSAFGPFTQEAKEMDIQSFPERIDRQVGAVTELFAQFTDEEMAKTADLFNTGVRLPKRVLLINLVWKQLVQYKMQLFLHAKASGNKDIFTSNLAMGMDQKK